MSEPSASNVFNMHPPIGQLGSDSPIEGENQDLLGFGPFSRSLAIGLVERAPKDGFVVGLQARWGMGKSSAVNLCLEQVRKIDAGKSDDEQIVIQAFNPWFYSGVDHLTTGYLTALGDAVEKVLEPRQIGLFVRSWRWLKNLAKKISGHSDALGATTAGMVTLFSGGTAAPLSGAIKGTIVSALKGKPTPNDLSKRFRKLVGQLGRKHGRVLLVIDDLDRLDPKDLRQVLSLVKTFGNLDGVTHLLVYDREIVDSALSESRPDQYGRRLPSYREKIVQAEFDLPNATHQGLSYLIERGIQPLIVNEPEFDNLTWYYAKRLALYTYLRSPRDVVRFTNGLSVIWPSVAGEAYFPDLFVLELWRLFDPEFYDCIRENKAVMTGSEESSIGSAERKAVIESIIERIPVARRKQVLNCVVRLFPNVREHIKDVPYASGNNVSGRWRIGDSKGFDVFFRMSPPDDEYTQRDLTRLRLAISNEDDLGVWLKEAASRKATLGGTFLPKLLHALGNMIGDLPDASLFILRFIIENGDAIVKQSVEEPALGLRGVTDEIASIASRCLFAIPEQQRFSTLKELLAIAGMSTRIVIVSSQYFPYHRQSQGDYVQNARQSQIPEECARSLLTELVADIKKNPDLLPQILLGSRALYLWNIAEGPEAVKEWISRGLNDSARVVFVINSVMSHVTSTQGEYRELRSIPDFLDVDAVQVAASALLSADKIERKDLELVTEYVKDSQQRQKLMSAGVL